jgi:hypothetical protein
MKLLIQTTANRFGYFIMKNATKDKLFNELEATKARLSETNAEMWMVRGLNRALFGESERLRTLLAHNKASLPDLGPQTGGGPAGNGAGRIGRKRESRLTSVGKL